MPLQIDKFSQPRPNNPVVRARAAVARLQAVDRVTHVSGLQGTLRHMSDMRLNTTEAEQRSCQCVSRGHREPRQSWSGRMFEVMADALAPAVPQNYARRRLEALTRASLTIPELQDAENWAKTEAMDLRRRGDYWQADDLIGIAVKLRCHKERTETLVGAVNTALRLKAVTASDGPDGDANNGNRGLQV